MTEQDAFLAAIRANPGDDLPRLVFADWLEERGEGERAEFIRVGCELATFPEHFGIALDISTVFANDEEFQERLRSWHEGRDVPPIPQEEIERFRMLSRRERELWTLNGYEWLQQMHPSVMWMAPRGNCFSRGFFSHIRCTAADWLVHGDAILATVPGLDEVELTSHFEGGAWPRSFLECRWPKEQVRKWTLPGRDVNDSILFRERMFGRFSVTQELVDDAGNYENYRERLEQELIQSLALPPHLFRPSSPPGS